MKIPALAYPTATRPLATTDSAARVRAKIGVPVLATVANARVETVFAARMTRSTPKTAVLAPPTAAGVPVMMGSAAHPTRTSATVPLIAGKVLATTAFVVV